MGDSCPTPNPQLLESYRNALYRVFEPNEFVIRIGLLSPETDALVHNLPQRSWTIITAWNPQSTPLSLAENLSRQDLLRNDLQALGFSILAARGEDPRGEWEPEESLLVLGIDQRVALELGVRYRQWAIVWGQFQEPAELVVCPLPD